MISQSLEASILVTFTVAFALMMTHCAVSERLLVALHRGIRENGCAAAEKVLKIELRGGRGLKYE